ncbi:MAG: hypothetical protein M1816_005531 [Peltula sp. TS41687]|nr:MAG: hypothetical protein M1816_005531 [Peltula sp. TS41687]
MTGFQLLNDNLHSGFSFAHKDPAPQPVPLHLSQLRRLGSLTPAALFATRMRPRRDAPANQVVLFERGVRQGGTSSHTANHSPSLITRLFPSRFDYPPEGLVKNHRVGNDTTQPAASSLQTTSPMLDILPIRLLPIRSTLGKEHLSADLARFSLDPSLAGVDLCYHGPPAPYPSPPMSGSPPLSDLPESQHEEHRQARETRRSSRNVRQENVPRTETETGQGQRGSPSMQQLQPPWTTSRPPPSSPSLFPGLSAPVVLGLRNDPRTSQGEHILLPTTPSQTPTVHQQRVSPRSPRTPRPPKTHVASACVNCRTAHLACDGKPQLHCLLAVSLLLNLIQSLKIGNGQLFFPNMSTCVDVPHKRRGRPRIRPLGEARPAVTPTLHGQQRLMRPPITTTHSSPTQIGGVPLISGPYRPLRPYVEELMPPQTRFPGFFAPAGVPMMPATFEVSVPGIRPSRGLAWAFLRMDFVFVKTSTSFQQALGMSGVDLGGTRLRDMVVEHDRSRIDRLERDMQDERARREPAYLPPIFAGNEAENIQRVQEAEIEEATQGSQERVEELTFIQADRQLRTYQVQFKLARTFIYFVVVILQLEASPVQQLPEPPPPLMYPHGFPGGAVPLQSYGAQVPFSYIRPSRTGLPSSVYAELGSPHYFPRDPSQFVAGPAAYRSPGSRPQALGYLGEELSPLGEIGPPVAALPWEERRTAMPGRRASAPHPQSVPVPAPVPALAPEPAPQPQPRRRTREYRTGLQLPPLLRGGPEPSQAGGSLEPAEKGEKRGHDEIEEGEQDEGDGRAKRPRMSVKEMLE